MSYIVYMQIYIQRKNAISGICFNIVQPKEKKIVCVCVCTVGGGVGIGEIIIMAKY